MHSICLVFLLVGHTHDAIDRFFIRLRVAIAGRDYRTVAALMKLIVDGLPGFNVRHSHLHTVWGWKDMKNQLKLPTMIGLRRVHAMDFFTYQGAVYVKWKHYMTSDKWSRSVLMIPQTPSASPKQSYCSSTCCSCKIKPPLAHARRRLSLRPVRPIGDASSVIADR